MEFSVGDKVVHPKYGPGEITDVQHRELVEGFEHYYVVYLLLHESTLYLPMRKLEDLGVRPVMSRSKLTGVLDTLHGMPHRLSKNFKKRQARIREKLATARPIQVAEAVRDLTFRQERSHLTKVDQDLLTRGRELLAAEMAAATDSEMIHAHQSIDAALQANLARESDEETVKQTATAESLVDKLLKRVKDNPVPSQA